MGFRESISVFFWIEMKDDYIWMAKNSLLIGIEQKLNWNELCDFDKSHVHSSGARESRTRVR